MRRRISKVFNRSLTEDDTMTTRSDLHPEELAELQRLEAIYNPLGWFMHPIYNRRPDGSQSFIAYGPKGYDQGDWCSGDLAFIERRLAASVKEASAV
jgi:hypothetical protein